VTEPHAARIASAGRVPVRRVALAVCVAAAIGIGAGVALHELDSHGSPRAAAGTLPAFHGQAAWAAGTRAAPVFTLRDRSGVPVSLSALRGRPVLLTFLDSQCKQQCPIQGRQLASILRRLPAAERPTLVVVSVNPSGDTVAGIRHATAEWGLAGPWAWHWLNGTRRQLATVWHSYGVTVDPSSGDIVHSLVLYLIDRDGYERTAYLYPFLPAFVQGDLAKLGSTRT
jgi:cytochrome oxidase Cu insertion factor (SCO1/SenC/PrrC family)